MPRIKAIFDADIIINLIETDSMNLALEILGCVYVSEYVYNKEIKKGTKAYRLLNKLKNKKEIKVLKYDGLAPHQQKVYKETYKVLARNDITYESENNHIDEGERITASFAKACNIYYYMSDDNSAAPYIRSLTDLEIINFCDILYMHIDVFGKNDIVKLEKYYKSFIDLYEEGRVPRVVKEEGKELPFIDMMGRCYDKFHKSKTLEALVNNIKINRADIRTSRYETP